MTDQFPIACLTVQEDDSVTATMYAPTLPPGEHDVYCAPPKAECEECEFLGEVIHRQGKLLTGVVNALKGQPPELTAWSHHDAPDLVASLVGERDDLARKLKIAEERIARYVTQGVRHWDAERLLCLMWDKYENGDACYEDPDNSTGYLGRAFRLSDKERDEILAAVADCTNHTICRTEP